MYIILDGVMFQELQDLEILSVDKFLNGELNGLKILKR